MWNTTMHFIAFRWTFTYKVPERTIRLWSLPKRGEWSIISKPAIKSSCTSFFFHIYLASDIVYNLDLCHLNAVFPNWKPERFNHGGLEACRKNTYLKRVVTVSKCSSKKLQTVLKSIEDFCDIAVNTLYTKVNDLQPAFLFEGFPEVTWWMLTLDVHFGCVITKCLPYCALYSHFDFLLTNTSEEKWTNGVTEIDSQIAVPYWFMCSFKCTYLFCFGGFSQSFSTIGYLGQWCTCIVTWHGHMTNR